MLTLFVKRFLASTNCRRVPGWAEITVFQVFDISHTGIRTEPKRHSMLRAQPTAPFCRHTYYRIPFKSLVVALLFWIDLLNLCLWNDFLMIKAELSALKCARVGAARRCLSFDQTQRFIFTASMFFGSTCCIICLKHTLVLEVQAKHYPGNKWNDTPVHHACSPILSGNELSQGVVLFLFSLFTHSHEKVSVF